MLTVEWLTDAIHDVIEIVDYIAQDNPSSAIKMYELFKQTAQQLSTMPYSGRTGRVAGMREKIVHPRYVMVYRVTHSHIEIVNVLHTSKLYP